MIHTITACRFVHPCSPVASSVVAKGQQQLIATEWKRPFFLLTGSRRRQDMDFFFQTLAQLTKAGVCLKFELCFISTVGLCSTAAMFYISQLALYLNCMLQLSTRWAHSSPPGLDYFGLLLLWSGLDHSITGPGV